MCWANRHTFTWSSSTASDAMPLSLRCECGAISREAISPVQHLQTEVARLRAALVDMLDGDCLLGCPTAYRSGCSCWEEKACVALSTPGAPESGGG